MAPADELDDDAVARLLAEDARAASARYASQGLSAMLPRRPAEGALRPNTRFLKNLVRDADSHNAALSRKEQNERRARLRQLNDPSSLRDRHSDGDDEHRKRRRRLDGRSHRESHGDGQRERSHRHKRRRRNSSSEDSCSRSPSPHQKHLQPSSHLDKHRIHHDDHRERNHKHRHKRRNSADERSRSRSPSPRRGSHRPSSSTAKHRTHGRRQHRSKEPSRDIPAHRLSNHHHASANCDSASSHSDPLEELVGPLPPPSPSPRSRGRGAHKQSRSAIDSHFAANYNPTLDIHPHPDSEEDSALHQQQQQQQEQQDWDMALEAFRDRQKWKQKHAERMREAGFPDEEIKKWQDSTSTSTSGKEKSAANLRWGKAGDAREWDQGKRSA